jgi:hypothetical protein
MGPRLAHAVSDAGYAVTAFFDVTSPVEAGSVTVAAGERRVVSCSKNMMLCSVKSP